jgi:hypothetical protein
VATGAWGEPEYGDLEAMLGNDQITAASRYARDVGIRKFTTLALLKAATGMLNGYRAQADNVPGATWVYDSVAVAWLMTGVAEFADAATRDAVLTAPVAGNRARLADSRLVWEYVGSSWIPLLSPERHLSDTTPSVRGVLVQSGIGKIAGAASATLNEAVTFPVAYSGVPVVVSSMLGQRATGAFNAAGLTAAQSLLANPQVPSTTGFTQYIYQTTGGVLSAANDYYYAWQARGVPA